MLSVVLAKRELIFGASHDMGCTEDDLPSFFSKLKKLDEVKKPSSLSFYPPSLAKAGTLRRTLKQQEAPKGWDKKPVKASNVAIYLSIIHASGGRHARALHTWPAAAGRSVRFLLEICSGLSLTRRREIFL